MGWRIVHVSKIDQMSLQLDNLRLQRNDQDIKIPLRDIFALVIEDLTCKLTSRLMIELSKNNVLVLLCNQYYLPECVVQPVSGHASHYRQMMKQLEWSKELKQIAWQQVVMRKIENQSLIMRKNMIENTQCEKIESLINKVEVGDLSNQEGQAARLYFNSFFDNEFTRQDSDYIENAALNYGYAILNSAIARTIVAKGLISGLGIHHKGERNLNNLASDLIEPFRQIVDYFVIKNPPNEYLTKEYRVDLINLLHAKVRIENKMQTVIRVIELTIDSLLRFFETGNPDKLQFPDVSKIVLYEP